MQPAESGVLSTRPSAACAPISAAVHAAAPLAFGEGNKNSGGSPPRFDLGGPNVSVTSPGDEQRHDATEADGKEPTSESSPADDCSASLTVRLPKTEENRPPVAAVPSPAKNDADRPQTGGANDDGKPPPPLRFAAPTAKPADPSAKPSETQSPAFQFGGLQNPGKSAAVSPSPKLPTLAFGAPAVSPPMAFAQFGAAPKVGDAAKPATPAPVLQFGAAPKVDDAKSTAAPVLQFGAPKVDDAAKPATPTPVLQFGAPKFDGAKSTTSPVLQFGAPKVDGAKSVAAPVMQFGASQAADGKPTTALAQFGTSKDNPAPVAAPSFSFGNNNVSTGETVEPAEPAVKFRFGAPKTAGPAPPQADTKNAPVFGSTGLQNQNLFSFGKTADPPKYDAAAADKSTVPKFQFGAAPAFGTPNAIQPKPVDGPAPKLVFGGQTADGKPAATSTTGMLFAAANSAPNPVFQFNSAGSDPAANNKGSPAGSFAFPSAAKAAPAFGIASSPQGFQFGAPKAAAAERSKTPFSVPAFGSSSQAAAVAPFKFGGNDKTGASSFGNAFAPVAAAAPSNRQTLQLSANKNAEKPAPAEPFKFGSLAAQSGSAFQFGASKSPENGPPKFGQATGAFSGFGGFGSPAPQQTATFGGVVTSSPQTSSPFGNAAPRAAPTFGAVASSPPSNAFGTKPGFQFGSAGSSAFAFGGANAQAAKQDSAFNFSAPPKAAASPFQFGSSMATPQFGVAQSQGFDISITVDFSIHFSFFFFTYSIKRIAKYLQLFWVFLLVFIYPSIKNNFFFQEQLVLDHLR